MSEHDLKWGGLLKRNPLGELVEEPDRKAFERCVTVREVKGIDWHLEDESPKTQVDK